jgi:hypothetical protein
MALKLYSCGTKPQIKRREGVRGVKEVKNEDRVEKDKRDKTKTQAHHPFCERLWRRRISNMAAS